MVRDGRRKIESLPEKPSARRWGTFWRLFLSENFSLEFEGVVQEDDLAGLAEELAVGRVECKMLHVAC